MKKLTVSLLALMMILGGMTGCSTNNGNSTTKPTSTPTPGIVVDEEKNAEVVIIGAGGGGLSAAIEAVNDGATKVTILEKTTTTGGSLNYTSGSMSGAETNIQQIDGITDTKDSYVQDILKNGDQKGNEKMIRAFVEEDVATIQWLWDNGLSDNKFGVDRVTNTMSVFAPEHALYSVKRTYKPSADDPKTYKSAAHEILDTVSKSLSDKITVEYQTEATQLVQNDKGQVMSVIATQGGKTVRYDATKGIIMATGGYSGNPTMLSAYTQFGGEYLPGGADTADGYGIYMMQEVGAGIDEKSLAYVPTFPMGLDTKNGPGKIAPTYTWKAGGICINQEGKRFVDETEETVEVREVTLEQQTGAIQYDVFTPKIIEDLQKNKASMFWDSFYAPEKPYNQFVVSASSLDELAQKINVPADSLKATVEAYNQSVESKQTDEFGRQYTEDSINTYNLAINKVEGDQYYAIALKALCVMTLGGVTTNESAQVLDTKGNVIPGLYAAGECVNMWGRFVSSGTGVMGPIVYGRIAARHLMANTPTEGYTLQPSSGIIKADYFVKEEKSTASLPTFDMSVKLKDGEYSATVDGQEGKMTVKTTIKDGKISAVELVEQHESSFTTTAQQQVPAQIVEKNSLEVDVVAGATMTSIRILEAVKACLEQAK